MFQLKDKHIAVLFSGPQACLTAIDLFRSLRKRQARISALPSKQALSLLQPELVSEACGAECPNLGFDPLTQTPAQNILPDKCDAIVLLAPADQLESLIKQSESNQSWQNFLHGSQRKILLVNTSSSGDLPNWNAWNGKQRALISQASFASNGRQPHSVSITDAADVILSELRSFFSPQDLSGRQILISTGPTLEDIDPVRFIGNRSTGKMGIALAEAAAERGASVDLIHGPVQIKLPLSKAVICTAVRSALEMRKAVFDHLAGKEAAILTAAVADYRPEIYLDKKIKKDSAEFGSLALLNNPDILAEIGACQDKPFLVGFAAESQDLVKNASTKLERKNCDMMCANDISSGETGFASDQNQITVLLKNGEQQQLPLCSKKQTAHYILDFVAKGLGVR